MAAIENLEIVVDVDISDALTNLQALKDELEDVADEIRSLRRQGRRGFTVQSDVESIEDDLARTALAIRAFERAHQLNIGTNVADFNAPGMGGGRGGGGGGGGAGAGLASIFTGIMDGDGLRSTIQNIRRNLSDFNENSELTNINMSDMHNILARLVPILIVFIGALPAAITAIYTLAAAAATAAAAFAAMAGFGALGLAMEDGQFQMENLTQAFREVQQDFLDAFAPLANRLQPLFEDALAGLEMFFDAVADEGDALMALTDEARAFGRFIIDFVPEALRTLAALVESMSGIFGGMADSLQRNFTSVVRDLVELTAMIVPALADFANTVGRALPAIIRMSLGFLMVADAIINILGALGRLLGMLGISPTLLGKVTAALLSLISLFALGSTIIGSVFVTSLIGAIKSLYTFALAANAANVSLLRMGKMAAIVAIGGLYNLISGVLSTIPALGSLTIAGYSASAALASLLTLLTIGGALALVGLAMSAAAGFMSMADSIDTATRSLKDFQSVQSGMSGSGFGGAGDDPYGYDPEDPRSSPGSGGVTVFNVESSGDPEEDRSNMEHADWMSGRSTGGG